MCCFLVFQIPAVVPLGCCRHRYLLRYRQKGRLTRSPVPTGTAGGTAAGTAEVGRDEPAHPSGSTAGLSGTTAEVGLFPGKIPGWTAADLGFDVSLYSSCKPPFWGKPHIVNPRRL